MATSTGCRCHLCISNRNGQSDKLVDDVMSSTYECRVICSMNSIRNCTNFSFCFVFLFDANCHKNLISPHISHITKTSKGQLSLHKDGPSVPKLVFRHVQRNNVLFGFWIIINIFLDLKTFFSFFCEGVKNCVSNPAFWMNFVKNYIYCLSKKQLPILQSKLLYEMVSYFMDSQYV